MFASSVAKAISTRMSREAPTVGSSTLARAPVGLRPVERLSRAEFEQLSADEQNDHVHEALVTLRESIPHSGDAVGAFIDARLYVQEFVEWAPTAVERLWPLHRAGIESNASVIHAALQEALDTGSLSPAHAEFAKNALQAEKRLVDVADEYI
jgi:hypothetical protein